MPGKPAARVGDMTAHGGTITGPGVPTVLIGKMPAATMGDMHVCPMMIPGTPPIPHVGGPIILGSTGVFIGKKPAARMGDSVVCGLPPSSIILGCMTVLIGEAGSGSQAGSAASAVAAAAHGVSAPGALKAMDVPKPAETKVESHAIDLEFNDAGGKPIKGVVFRMKDPTGHMIHGASDAQGKWHSSAYSKAGSYSVRVLNVHSAKCDKSKLAIDESCTVKASAVGYDDGQKAIVYISLVDAHGHVEFFERASAKVRGEQVELQWKLRKAPLEEFINSHERATPLTQICFQVVVGFQCATAKWVELELGAKDKLKARIIEIPDFCFHDKSAVPCLDDKGILVQQLAYALGFAEENKDKELLILSHEAKAQDSKKSYDLTEKRGLALKSILDCDATLWVASVSQMNCIEDIQQSLKALAKYAQWPCHLEEVSGSQNEETNKAIKGFQEEYNRRFLADIKVDGQFGISSWLALHRVLCGLVSRYLTGEEPADSYPTWQSPRYGYSDGDGVYPCADSFAIASDIKDQFKSKSNQRIELVFVPRNKVRVVLKDRSVKLTKKDCLLYDSELVEFTMFPDKNIGHWEFGV